MENSITTTRRPRPLPKLRPTGTPAGGHRFARASEPAPTAGKTHRPDRAFNKAEGLEHRYRIFGEVPPTASSVTMTQETVDSATATEPEIAEAVVPQFDPTPHPARAEDEVAPTRFSVEQAQQDVRRAEADLVAAKALLDEVEEANEEAHLTHTALVRDENARLGHIRERIFGHGDIDYPVFEAALARTMQCVQASCAALPAYENEVSAAKALVCEFEAELAAATARRQIAEAALAPSEWLRIAS